MGNKISFSSFKFLVCVTLKKKKDNEKWELVWGKVEVT